MTRARAISTFGAVLLAGVAGGGAAHAGGLARPNNISARGVSLGGAFVAVADDATAWHFNPAGAAFADPGLHLGAEVVIAPRTFVPVDADGNRGPVQAPDTPVVPLPALGVAVRVSDKATVGAGIWNTFGGRLGYCADRAACMAEHQEDMLTGVIDNSQNFVIELVGGASYRVNNRLSVGGAVRVGYGVFKVMTTARPTDSEVSASGLGIGATLGIMWRPSDCAAFGASWRSSLTVQATGNGALGADVDLPIEYAQRWPQSASIGGAFAVGKSVTVATQLDWTQWSRLEQLDVIFPTSTFVQTYPLDWDDTYGVRAGVEWRARPRLAFRTGAYFDSNAIPDYTIERQYIDRNKVGISYGASVGVGAWRFDFGGDTLGLVGSSPRTVPDNSADVGGFGALRNVSPGDYSSKLFTFELAAVRRL